MKRSFEGSIYQAKDKKTWFARLRYTDKDGVRREKKRICKTHAAAKEKIKALKAEIEVDNSDRKTFRQLDAFYRKKYMHSAKFVDGQKISGFRQALHGLNHYLDVALEHFGDRFIDTSSPMPICRLTKPRLSLCRHVTAGSGHLPVSTIFSNASGVFSTSRSSRNGWRQILFRRASSCTASRLKNSVRGFFRTPRNRDCSPLVRDTELI